MNSVLSSADDLGRIYRTIPCVENVNICFCGSNRFSGSSWEENEFDNIVRAYEEQ